MPTIAGWNKVCISIIAAMDSQKAKLSKGECFGLEVNESTVGSVTM